MYEVSIFGSVRAAHPSKNLGGTPSRGGGGKHTTLPQTSLQMNTPFTFLSFVFILWRFIYVSYELVAQIGFQVSDRQCCPFISFFPLLLFLTAHGRNSPSRPRNSDVLQPASEKTRKKTQNGSVTVQLFKAGILDLDGKLARNTPTWRVQRKWQRSLLERNHQLSRRTSAARSKWQVPASSSTS